MPPRPFPYPLKVGIDVCRIPRIKSLLTTRIGNGMRREKATAPLNQFLSKLLTWPERQYFWGRFKSQEEAYANIDSVSQYLAGRWAAKEACRKGCSQFGFFKGLHGIVILPISSDHGSVRPTGLILRETLHPYKPNDHTNEVSAYSGPTSIQFDMDTVDGQYCEISITHDGDYAQAVALVPDMPESWAAREGTKT